MPFNNMNNNYQASRYIVDIDGTTPFATIQSAIDQTVTDGITSATVMIRPGTYDEALVLVAGINLQGSEGEVYIRGIHTPPATGSIMFSGLNLTTTADILFDAAAGTCNIKFYDCTFYAVGGTYDFVGQICDLALWTGDITIESCNETTGCTNSIIFNNGSSAVDIIDCPGIGSGAVSATLTGITRIINSRINCPLGFVDGDVQIENSTISDIITITDPAVTHIYNSYLTHATACIDYNSTGVLDIGNTVIDVVGSPVITGTGTALEIGEVTFMNDSVIAGTLTQTLVSGCFASNFQTYGVVRLPETSVGADNGVIYIETEPYLHSMGTENTFVGERAGNFTLTTATSIDSVGIGTESLNDITSAAYSTAVGAYSLDNLTTGDKNLALGFQAGTTITTGTSNVLIANPGSAAAESNVIRIGVDGAGAGQQDSNYQAGIYQATTGATKEVVYVDSNFKLSSSNLGITQWIEANTDLTAAVNTGYVVNITVPGLLTITIPTTSILGDVVEIAGLTAGMWSIAQNALQVIHFSGVDTTVGVGGSLSATTRYDTIKLLCVVADTEWIVLASSGVFNLV